MEDGWKVGLASISLPNSKVSLSPLVDGIQGNRLMEIDWYEQLAGVQLSPKMTTEVYIHNVEKDRDVIDGVSFMKSMLNKRKKGCAKLASFGSDFQDEQGKGLFLKFKWQENGDLIIGNSNMDIKKVSSKSAPPDITIRNTLAK